MKDNLKNISSNFRIYGDFLDAVPFGCGHINSTYKVTFNQAGTLVAYLFQKINTNIFKDPYALMSNISRVIQHLQNKLSADIENSRKTLTLVPAKSGEFLYKDNNDGYWRVYLFIKNAVTYEIMKDTDTAFNVAKSFGEFQKLLVDIPGTRLSETIVDFHNTPKRYSALEQAIEKDIGNRAKDVKKEIDFILSRSPHCDRMLQKKVLLGFQFTGHVS